MFYFDKLCGKTILKSNLLTKNCFFTTRETVITSKEEDMQGLVEENRSLICQYFNIDKKDFVSPVQTHTSNIEVCEVGKADYPETDGLILTNNKQAIFLNFADCTPVVLFDKKQEIGAIIHAGWRGTVGKIAVKGVQNLVENFGSNVKDLIAVVGPAISICCYNVGDEVLEQLRASVKDFSNLSQIREGNVYVDLKEINAQQLKEAGVREIDICPYCTSCDNDMFFSYRKENATTNRHSAVLFLG